MEGLIVLTELKRLSLSDDTYKLIYHVFKDGNVHDRREIAKLAENTDVRISCIDGKLHALCDRKILVKLSRGVYTINQEYNENRENSSAILLDEGFLNNICKEILESIQGIYNSAFLDILSISEEAKRKLYILRSIEDILIKQWSNSEEG